MTSPVSITKSVTGFDSFPTEEQDYGEYGIATEYRSAAEPMNAGVRAIDYGEYGNSRSGGERGVWKTKCQDRAAHRG